MDEMKEIEDAAAIPAPPNAPGSYVLKDGAWVPNPNDEAMMARQAAQEGGN